MEAIGSGQIIAGKYRVERLLGRGGMGYVVLAEHVVLRQPVAIKFLIPEALRSREMLARFEREARAMFGIRSEHVARVFDYGHTETQLPFIVMEYLEGEEVACLIARERVPVETAIEIVLQAAAAVAEAHALGIIHRDLKPSNLFNVTRPGGQPHIKVLDFGISKFTADSPLATEELGMTRTMAVMGSPLYMAPEQLEGAKYLDARCDIWALGVILYELLAGEVPFLGNNLRELALTIAMVPTPKLSALREDLPSGLEAVIECCLAKERDARFPSVAALATALIPFTPDRLRPLALAMCSTLGQPPVATPSVALQPELNTARGTAIAVRADSDSPAGDSAPVAAAATQGSTVVPISSSGWFSKQTTFFGGLTQITGSLNRRVVLAVAFASAAAVGGALVFGWRTDRTEAREAAEAVSADVATPSVVRSSIAPPVWSPAQSVASPGVTSPGVTSLGAVPVTGTPGAVPFAAPSAHAGSIPTSEGRDSLPSSPIATASAEHKAVSKSAVGASKASSAASIRPGHVPSVRQRAGCDPPYTWVDGHKRFKHECFL